MKWLTAFLGSLLFATTALAADNPISCSGASCKVTIQPRNSGGTQQTVATFDGAGSLTYGLLTNVNLAGTTSNTTFSKLYGAMSVFARDGYYYLAGGVDARPFGLTMEGTSTGSNSGNAIYFRRSENQPTGHAYASIWGITNTVGSGGGLNFYTSNSDSAAPSLRGSVDNGGTWTLGPANRQTTFGTAQGNNVSIFGAANSQQIAVANSGTQTFKLGNGNNNFPGFCLFAHQNSGGGAIVFFSASTATILSQGGTSFVAGAPATAQIGITFSNTTSLVTLTAGATGGSGVNVACMSASL